MPSLSRLLSVRTMLAATMVAFCAPGPTAQAQLAPKRTLAATAPQGCASLLAPAATISGSSMDDSTRRLISAGQEASLQGEHEVARDAFAQAAKRSPQNAVLAYYLGREYEALNANTDAVREYCRYLKLSPNARDADEVQGRIVRLTPRSQLAQADEARANFSSAVALLERRQYIAADSMFGSIATKLPNSAEVYYNRALTRAARGERTLAMQDFQKYFDLAGNPSDRSAINTAVSRLQDRVFSTTQALSSGLALPGMGQMSTGRPFLGVSVLGAVAGALVWGMSAKQGFEVATFQDPFGNPYIDSLPKTTRPNFPIAAVAAAAIWGGAAYEAMTFAQRSRARAESIIRVGVATSDDANAFVAFDRRAIGVGLEIRVR